MQERIRVADRFVNVDRASRSTSHHMSPRGPNTHATDLWGGPRVDLATAADLATHVQLDTSRCSGRLNAPAPDAPKAPAPRPARSRAGIACTGPVGCIHRQVFRTNGKLGMNRADNDDWQLLLNIVHWLIWAL